MNVRYSSYSDQLYRFAWNICCLMFFRYSFRTMFFWRRSLLRFFGASIHQTSRVYPSAFIYNPSKLTMHANSCMADYVCCYNVDSVTICENVTVSQYTHICTAGHDYRLTAFPLISKPIVFSPGTWICANCFVSPGVVTAENTVLLPFSCLAMSTLKDSVYGGVPAKFVKKRYS